MNDVVTHKSGCTCSNFVLVFTLLYLEFIKKKIYKEKNHSSHHHSMKVNMELAKLRTIQRLLATWIFSGEYSVHKVGPRGVAGSLPETVI